MNIKKVQLKCLKFYIPVSGGMIKFLQENIFWSFYDKQKKRKKESKPNFSFALIFWYWFG